MANTGQSSSALKEALAVLEGTSEEKYNVLKDSESTRYGPVDCGLITNYFASVGKYNSLKEITSVHDSVSAAIDTLNYRSVLDFSLPGVIDMLDGLVTAEILDTSDKAALLSMAEINEKVFPNLTLHDVKICEDTVDTISVSQVDGYAVITTTSDCEIHNPRLLALNPRTNKWVRVNSFYGVSSAGTYDCKVPSEWHSSQLRVDDAYGVIR